MIKPGDVTLLITLIEIATKAAAAIKAIKTDNPEAYAAVGKHHADAEIQLETRRKRLEDLRLELACSFEHEGRLTDLLVRQRELLKQLDLDKDEAGSTKVDAEEVRQAA